MIQPTKKAQIIRKWHLIDATDRILGRLSTQLVPLLTGKTKPYYQAHLDCGDHVVVVNAEKIRVSGRKETDKIYQRYSGYPGGRRVQTLVDLRAKFPTRILEHAVSGMLPDNKLKAEWVGRLHLFIGDKHPYEDKFKPSNINNSSDKSDMSHVSHPPKTPKIHKPVKISKTK